MLYIEESIKCYLYCILITGIAIFMYVGTREYENIHVAKSPENIKLAEIKKIDDIYYFYLILIMAVYLLPEHIQNMKFKLRYKI